MTPCLFQNYFRVPSNNSHLKAIFSNLGGGSILSFFILCFFYLDDLLLLITRYTTLMAFSTSMSRFLPGCGIFFILRDVTLK